MPRLLLIFLALLALAIPTSATPPPPPVKVIFDTDMDSDCDDLVAIAVLHALADRGEAQILATTVSTLNPSSPLCLDAVNTFYKRPQIPVGVPKGNAANRKSKYADGIAKEFPHALASADKAPEAVDLWRSILAKADDGSVTIVTVGYLTNVADLLRRPADANYPAGLDLAKRKVKAWVCMGGNFVGDPPKDDLKLGNVNFTTERDGSLHAIRNWPGKLIFVGREVCSVPSGLKVGARFATLPEKHPVRRGYELYFGGVAKDRHVADPTTVYFAVRGLGEFWSLRGPGTMNLDPAMTFTWQAGGAEARQLYLAKRTGTDREVEKAIESLIVPPAR